MGAVVAKVSAVWRRGPVTPTMSPVVGDVGRSLGVVTRRHRAPAAGPPGSSVGVGSVFAVGPKPGPASRSTPVFSFCAAVALHAPGGCALGPHSWWCSEPVSRPTARLVVHGVPLGRPVDQILVKLPPGEDVPVPGVAPRPGAEVRVLVE